jgi:four helix bundle protein
MVSSYRELFVFKKACELAGRIYRMTGDFPADERYSLISQMRRAASSIPMNIAEGYRRTTRREYIHFLTIASGSCSELDAQLILSRDIDLITTAQYDAIHADQRFVSILLTRLIAALKKKKRDCD